MTHRPPLALVGGVLWLSLLAPPLRAALEATMTAQMLAQLPLLGAAGWMVARAVPPRATRALARWDGGGVPGLLLASLASAVWMVPRMLDSAVNDPWTAVLKFTSVPLLVGAPIALSWPRMGFVARGVFLLEAVASAFRLGWLFLIAPERLCSNYLLGDQRLLGKALLVIGAVACLVIAWRLMWGHVRVEPDVP